ncbi:MAG: tRNA preQ1(34) S-adenosylmethionine ribosyltransferase-isomerase QueA [Candidatus Microgenomates bacterium]
MWTSLFDYNLPKNLIANSPANPRDSSRLMIINRKTDQISEYVFRDITNMLGKNDILVLNKTKVFPARLISKKVTGGKVEILLHKNLDTYTWEALTRPGLKAEQKIVADGILAETIKRDGELSILKFNLDRNKLIEKLQKIGLTPLPPYIHSNDSEKDLRHEYQTIYAKTVGSAAAPTAGFHFTKELLERLQKKGVQIEYITLHVGLGTFAPVKTKTLEEFKIHEEEFFVDNKTINTIKEAKSKGKRIIAVGTTSARTLETIASGKPSGSTNLFIYPPYKFKIVDALITNFHLPESTLLALVSAFVSFPNTDTKFKDFGSSLMGKAYRKAIKNKFRFYSFGDACLII